MNKERSWYKSRMVAVLAMICGTAGLSPLFASAHVITVAPDVDCIGQIVTVTVTQWVGHVEIKNLASGKLTERVPTSVPDGTAAFTIAEIGGNGDYTAGRQEDQTGHDPTPVGFKVNCTKAQPAIATTPSQGGAIGIAIHDVATVTGGNTPTGNVTFKLFDPSQATCAGTPVFTGTVGLVGAAATSGNYTTAAVGTYRWTATYNGDSHNSAATSGCQDELVTTNKARPAIATVPSHGGVVGTVIHDAAKVTGGHSPTGAVTFHLYDPSQANCTGTPVFTATKVLAGGQARSGPYTTIKVGTYRWVATYNGDANNTAATSGCTDEEVTTTSDQPAIATTPSIGGVLRTAIHDVANVTGGQSPTGNVTFNLYDPSEPSCDGEAVFADTVSLVDGQATSGDYTTIAAGTYRWTATYNGDAKNLSATSGCQAELVTITRFHTRITTTPSAGGPVGTVIHDVAKLIGGHGPRGDVTFNLYDPSQSTCQGTPVFTDTQTLANRQATSGNYTTAAVGIYRWTASYNGDAKNQSATSGCQAEQVTTTQAQPGIATIPSPGGVVGIAIHDSAKVSGGHSPTGTVTFNLYDPSQATCAGTPVFTDNQGVLSGEESTSGTYATKAVGTYRWTATYNGDANNLSATSGCQDEQVIVTSPTSGVEAAAVSLPNTGHGDVIQSLLLALLMLLLGTAFLLGQAFYRPVVRREV